MTAAKTAQTILDVAQELCQARGWNAFSYKDIALALDIKPASIHYHYPTKTDLGLALMQRYSHEFASALSQIEAQESDPRKEIRALTAHMESLIQSKKICLCAMLASDLETLDPRLQAEVRHFFERPESWLEARLTSGKKRGQFAFSKPAKAVAHALLACMHGMLMSARSFGPDNRFAAGKDWLLSSIEAA
jgi:TetR/AcrR family transcriptional repressor of nem operon